MAARPRRCTHGAPGRLAAVAAAVGVVVVAAAAAAAAVGAMFIQTTATGVASQLGDIAEVTIQYTVSDGRYLAALTKVEQVQQGLTTILRNRYGSTEAGDVTLLNLYMYTRTNDDDIPTSYFFTVQVRAVVRGLAAAQGVSTTLLPAVEALPASRLRIDSYPGIVYRAANSSAVRIDATRAAAARARAQTDAIAAGLGARVGRLNFASLNADSFDERSSSGGGDSARSVFRASVRTEYYVR